MIIDRTHIRWGVATVAATAAVTFFYLANNDPESLPIPVALPAWLGPVPPLLPNPGATPLGLIYGTLGLLIFLFAALIGWRRNHPTWKVGRIQAWLKAHIWLTILTIPLVLFHCGFHMGGPMTQVLMALYTLVMVSGFWGLILQNIVPRIMKEQLPQEVIFEQIPYLRGQLLSQAEADFKRLTAEPSQIETESAHSQGGVATVVAPPVQVTSLRPFLEQDVMPFLRTANTRRLRLRDRAVSDDLFRLLRLQLPELSRPALDRVQGLCDEKRQLDLQARLHRWLHVWLFVHAPASLLLVVLTLWHAIVAAFTYA